MASGNLDPDLKVSPAKIRVHNIEFFAFVILPQTQKGAERDVRK